MSGLEQMSTRTDILSIFDDERLNLLNLLAQSRLKSRVHFINIANINRKNVDFPQYFVVFGENQPLIEPVRRDTAIGGTVFDQCKQTFKRSTQGTPVILLAFYWPRLAIKVV